MSEPTLNDDALKAAYERAEITAECSCDDEGFYCFYRLSIGEKIELCVKRAVSAYLAALREGGGAA